MRHELAAIDVSKARGLEIGPLTSPRVRKAEGQVFYIDHASADELREKYARTHRVGQHLDEIVDIDYVVRDGKSIAAAVGADAPFDYVIASHVMEHVPDPVGWMADIARVLAPGGILSLVLPDMRYCFDINRSPTETSDLVDAYLRNLTRPSLRQMYDFFSISIADRDLDAAAIWAGTADYSKAVRNDVSDPATYALERCRHAMHSSDFVDIHCQVFTPTSFLEVFGELAHLDLVDYEIAHFAYTEFGNLEFYVTLRLLDDEMGRDLMKERQLDSIANIPAEPGSAPNRMPPEPDRPANDGLAVEVVSARELRMLKIKREGMRSFRNLLTKARVVTAALARKSRIQSR